MQLNIVTCPTYPDTFIRVCATLGCNCHNAGTPTTVVPNIRPGRTAKKSLGLELKSYPPPLSVSVCRTDLTAMYSPDELRALNSYTLRPSRTVRKVIFSVRLWRPARQRRHSRRLQLRSSRPNRAGLCNEQLIVGCVNARSVGSKAATLNRTIIDERLDILAVVETWH